MSIFNINNILNGNTVETARIEFKEGWNPQEVLHSICAFSNDIREFGGGYIFIGIAEEDGMPVLPPKGLQLNQLDSIQKKILELCHHILPNVYPKVFPEEFQGRHILVIKVLTGEDRPYTAPSTLSQKGQRKIYVRPMSTSIPVTPVLEKELRELASFKHFDAKINPQATLSDLDIGLIREYLYEQNSQLYNESLELSLKDLCLQMEIARDQFDDCNPFNIALLMFCKKPEMFFKGCQTNVVEFNDEKGISLSEIKFYGPIHIQIRQILDYFKTTIIKRYTNKNTFTAEAEIFYNYPFPALREVVINALYHRSYEDEHPNEIRIYKHGNDRRIEIHSYPGPLPPINQDTLAQERITARQYRNIRLGELLKQINLAEKYATGIPTIRSSLRNNGSPDPILFTDDERSVFVVTLFIHPETPREKNGDTYIAELDLLTDYQQTILEYIRETPRTFQEIEDYVPEMNLNDEVKWLMDQKFISVKEVKTIFIYYISDLGRAALKASF